MNLTCENYKNSLTICTFAKTFLMFVQANTVREIKKYFSKNLSEFYSESEINQIVKIAVTSRLEISTGDYLISDENLLSESDLLFFRSIVKKILANEPFQYIIGTTEFFGLEFKTDKRALIPRPETEELVDWITEHFPKSSAVKGLDLCTGSGCIAIALKSFYSNSDIMACDLSEEAIELAQENSEKLKIPVQIFALNALEETSYAILNKNSFDFWVSNPPYIPQADASEMLPNVLQFEPAMALFVSNDDPLIFYREIAVNALNYLKNNGLLFFELNENYAERTIDLMKEIGFVNIELRKDLQGKSRMLKVQKP